MLLYSVNSLFGGMNGVLFNKIKSNHTFLDRNLNYVPCFF